MDGMNYVHHLGPRVPVRRSLAAQSEQETVGRAWNVVPSRVVGRSSGSSDCSSSTSSNTCEKPTNMNLPTQITVGVL